jgi:hypothetical protein
MALELHPTGHCHVSLPYNGKHEHYSWRKVTTSVNNLIVGPLSLDHFGDMEVVNHRTGSKCVMSFQSSSGGWFSSGVPLGTINGSVIDSNGKFCFQMSGNWMHSISAKPVMQCSPVLNKLQLWKRNQLPASSAQNFNFTDFALGLNECSEQLERCLPPTDCRQRPDQRAMEHGLWEKADKEKERLENLQRHRRRELHERFEEDGIPSGPPQRGIHMGEEWWTPRWFIREMDPDTQSEMWRFTHDYWRYRETGAWPHYVLDIFGTRN